MSPYRDFFKDIDFDKDWEEEDWERFFAAQDKLAKESSSGPARSPFVRSRESSLSFRRVLRQFGMDPDDPLAPPLEFDHEPEAPARGNGRARFWEEGSSLECLSIYCQSKCYAYRFTLFCDRFYGGKLYKTYKSAAHRRRQDALHQMLTHAAEVPRNIAFGHELGYAADGIKGNIARCKRALGHADACVGLLSRLPARRFPGQEHERLFRETLSLRRNLVDWIAFLRRNFA
jgi:hypothetical protein